MSAKAVELQVVIAGHTPRNVRCHSGVLLSDVLRKNGMPLNTRCAGKGLCDSCMVEINGQIKRGCETRVERDATVLVPSRSHLVYTPRIVTEFRTNIPCGDEPLYECRGSGELAYGAAVDIGTTTVALMLVDLRDGRIISQASMFNRQMHLGDDVVTRIQLCATDQSMIGKLQVAVAEETLWPLLQTASGHGKVDIGSVKCMSIAGNTTMLHLLVGEDPSAMGTAPFTPAFLDYRHMRGAEVFAEYRGDIHLLPSAAAYVGADLTAGVVACGMLYDEGPTLLVDVGTNGEIILKHGDRLIGCATAAGPAFEGAGLTCGMRAADGAVAYIHMENNGHGLGVKTQILGAVSENGSAAEERAVGLCGSAYIDFLAEGRRTGLLSVMGGFELIAGVAERLSEGDSHQGPIFRVAEGTGGRSIGISRRDVANLLQSKAAIAAGVQTLLSEAQLKPEQIRRVYLAGGFGTKLRVANAIACGLLPGFAVEQVQAVGNSALAGAYLALLDRSLLGDMKRAASEMRVLELNKTPGFEDCFIDQLMLPPV